MPMEFGMWRIDGELAPLKPLFMDKESRLEDILERDISVTGLDLMVVGRQVHTPSGNRVDLLAVDVKGDLSVIELKRARTAREVVAQVLDYATWVSRLSYDEVVSIYKDYARQTERTAVSDSFEQAFSERFGVDSPPSLNEGHQLVIVASELDTSAERIVCYLSEEHGVPINVVFFRYFRDGEREYVARSWLADPLDQERRDHSRRARSTEVWNGRDFYVAIGEGKHRTWEDCRRYGFVAAGQGQWYSRSLEALFPGARIFACIPKVGYVGAGVVKEAAVPVKRFTLVHEGKEVPVLDVPLKAEKMDENAEDLDRCEYLVKVEWVKTVEANKAIWEKGMFANQNIACKLRNKFTLNRLSVLFGLEE